MRRSRWKRAAQRSLAQLMGMRFLMGRTPRRPCAALLLIRLASALVPAAARGDWRREWESEIRHACETMRERGDPPLAIRAQLMHFARGAFHDALWHGRGFWSRDRLTQWLSHRSQSAGFCLASLAALVLAITILSGFLPRTRAALFPLPYRDAGRIATVTEEGSFATRAGIHGWALDFWRTDSALVEEFATYSWSGETARVSPNFFALLGAHTIGGGAIHHDELFRCGDCVVLSYDFSRRIGARESILLHGHVYRVAAVLEKGFWFLSPQISVWRIGVPDQKERTAVVARLGPDVTKGDAAAELASILHAHGENVWQSIDVRPVAGAVRGVFGSFALALVLATVVVGASTRARAPISLFFVTKTILLLLAILLSGIEFTRASSLTMLGGTDISTEPLSTWLFLLGCMCVLYWSLADERRRCRVCLSRLGLAAHVGCPGCLLLDWSGTELVCVHGHGMLHVPEMAASWAEAERWTALDESWQVLFQRT